MKNPFFLFLIAVLLLAPPIFACTPKSGYTYCQDITLNTDGISLGANVTNDHVIWIDILKTNTNFWNNETYGNGNGITFTDTTNATEYDFEFEHFDGTNDDANAWVEISDTFPSASDLVISMHYAGANSSQADGVNTYSSDYNAVWHLNDASSPAQDATTNNIDLTHANSPTLNANAEIDGGVTYASASSQKSTHTTFWDGAVGNYTFSMWFNYASAQTDWAGFISKVNSSGTSEPIRLRKNSSGKIDWLVRNNGNTDIAQTTTTSFTTGTWYNLVGTRNAGSGQMILYLNGTAEHTLAGNAGVVGAGTGEDFRLAEGSGDVVFFNGSLDEVRIIDRVLSADEVKLVYNSQKLGFLTFGAQTAGAQAPDLNVNYPNNTGHYFKGGSTISIDFNVSDADTNAAGLLFDLNYHTSATQGAGTVIINDGNVASTAGLKCDSNNLVTRTVCHYSWTVPSLDANRFILASASDSTASDFDASDNNFYIDSTAPRFLTILPDQNYTRNGYPLDFNATITDDDGSGSLRCATRVYIDGTADVSLDSNVTATLISGNQYRCSRSVTSGANDLDKVRVGFIAVDQNLNQSADYNLSQEITFDPPDPDYVQVYERYFTDDDARKDLNQSTARFLDREGAELKRDEEETNSNRVLSGVFLGTIAIIILLGILIIVVKNQ